MKDIDFVNNVIINLSNEETTNIKFVAHKKLWNFVVENFFIWIRLGHQNVVWKIALPNVFFGTRQRNFFAECFLFDTRQSLLCRVQRLCRVFFIWLSAKPSLPSTRKKRSAKPPALDEEADSGSVWSGLQGVYYMIWSPKLYFDYSFVL
jgi:hypothetical protein